MKERKKASDGLDFAPLPHDGKPGDGAALRRILSGERGLKVLYDALSRSLKGDARFLVELLARDYDRRFSELLASGTEILKTIKGAGANDVTPPEKATREQAAAWHGAQPRLLVRHLSGFAQRALVTGSLVPWISDAQEVNLHFKAACEAEDAHLGLLDSLAQLLE